ncbi:AAA family ATPase, partial [Myroides odoratimimus]|uniref:AAA domain-containing protein n=1 Tax=Myroides odoratimimus TaxID=76832 RepID=UPI0025770FE0
IPIGHGYHSPRLDQKFTCFTLAPGLERPTKWTDISYVEILKDRNRSDTKVIDFTASKREGWITMLIREIDSEFVDSLQYNQILGFGPVIPPYEYIENLLAFSKGISVDQSNIWNDILSFKYRSNKDNYPILLTEEIDIAKLIIEKVDESKVFILQGPPGTGKTHQIADLASRLVSKGNSVLLTALTNKAALEVCTKCFFDKLFDLEKIFKL